MANKIQWRILRLKFYIQFTIALLLSLVMTVINYGFSGPFSQNWAKAFIVAFLIIPLALRLIPPIAAHTRAVLGNRSPFIVRSVVAICVAAMMEGLIALAVTLAQRGLAPGWPVMWGSTFLKALPIGLMIGFTMTFIVQPRMQKLASTS